MELELLKRVIDNPEGEDYEWLAIMQLFWKPKKPVTDEEREVLKRAAVFNGYVRLTHMGNGPHRAPPDYFIRLWAQRVLEDNP